MHRSTLAVLVVILVLLTLAPAAGSAPAAPPPGAPTLVSYQGHVLLNGAPYTGDGYFKFAIVDGAEVSHWSNDDTSSDGSEPTHDVQLPVTNGLFSVLLGDATLPQPDMVPLTAAAFADSERYLRVWFSSTGERNTYVQLGPDRRIGSAPYALVAQQASHANEADNAANADNADALNGLLASAFMTEPQNVVIVAKSAGDFTTISAALASITTASTDNRFLVWVAPGVYTEQVIMKEYVDIAGAGELLTKITYGGSAADNTGTVYCSNLAELRDLTVENSGGAAYATGIHCYQKAPRLTRLRVVASGGVSGNRGVYNVNSQPIMSDITASASGGVFSRGVTNSGSSPTMSDVTAGAENATDTNYGLENWSSSSPSMSRVSATASGGTKAYGVYNNLSSPAMIEVTAKASGGSAGIVHGVYNVDSSPTMERVTATATGGYTCAGVANKDSSPVMSDLTASGIGAFTMSVGMDNERGQIRINGGRVAGDDAAIENWGAVTLRVAGTQLVGGVGDYSEDDVKCAGVVDANYVFYTGPTCP